MPFNFSGTLAAFHALVRPRLIIPNLLVQDIRALDFVKLHKAGYKGVVLDKDNCLESTLPHQDALIPDLQIAWEELKHEFGPHNLLIVSNSAGTRDDVRGLAAESVSHHLGAPVLHHSSLKPSYKTMASVRRYFTSLPSPISDSRELVVIGDRVLTDTVLGNRLGAYTILVTRDWESSFKTRLTGSAERRAIQLANRWAASRPSPTLPSEFVREVPEKKDEVKLGHAGSTWTWTGRALGWGSHSGKHG